MITVNVEITQTIKVTIDETRFTPEFMEEFRNSFYNFTCYGDHIVHIAQLRARGLFSDMENEFLEGYGVCSDMGIKADIVDVDVSLI